MLDGWSLPILLREIFAGYYGQRLPAAASYRSFVSLAGRSGPRRRPKPRGREVLAGFDTPTLVGPPDRLEPGQRGVESARRCPPKPPGPSASWPARTTPPSAPCCRPRWAQVLMLADRPARRRLRHRGLGPARRVGRRGIDGGPVDQHGAGAGEHHRDHHHRRPARPTATAPQRHPRAPAPGAQRDSPRHRSRPTCSTLFSLYENYPIDTARRAGTNELAITR